MAAGQNELNADLVSCFHSLTPSSIHDIFKTVASFSLEDAKAMCLAAKCTRDVAVPHLYETLFLHDEEDVLAVLNAVPVRLDDGTEVSPTHFTKNLWFGAGVDSCTQGRSEEEVTKLFTDIATRFPAVENLTIRGDAFYQLLLASKSLPVAQERTLRLEILPGDARLDIHPFTAQGKEQVLAECMLFRQVTHLTLYNSDLLSEMDLSLYTQLSHLAVTFNPWSKEEIPVVMKRALSAPKLEMAVLMIPEDWSEMEVDGVSLKDTLTSTFVDARIHVAPMVFADSERWCDVIKGNDANIWAIATDYSKESGFTAWIQSLEHKGVETPTQGSLDYSIGVNSLVEIVA